VKRESEETKAVIKEPQSDSEVDNLTPTGQLRVIAGRAAIVYIALFLGLGLLMSLLGVNPLANEGLMPKALLVFVGLAVFMTLAGDLARNSRQGWLNLSQQFERFIKGPDDT
jgi:hypothetical protein